jgi:hypothetical protein
MDEAEGRKAEHGGEVAYKQGVITINKELGPPRSARRDSISAAHNRELL